MLFTSDLELPLAVIDVLVQVTKCDMCIEVWTLLKTYNKINIRKQKHITRI